MTQRTASASWLKNLCDMFAAEGVNVGPMLQDCGLCERELQDSDVRYPSEYVGHLWDAAVLHRPPLHLARELGGAHVRHKALRPDDRPGGELVRGDL